MPEISLKAIADRNEQILDDVLDLRRELIDLRRHELEGLLAVEAANPYRTRMSRSDTKTPSAIDSASVRLDRRLATLEDKLDELLGKS